MVEALDCLSTGGAWETGLYRPGRPMLLRSEGAIEGAYPAPELRTEGAYDEPCSIHGAEFGSIMVIAR